MVFCEHLLKLRTEKGLTQGELAQEICVSERAYRNYERGLREPPLVTLIALADFYQISLDELVCRDFDPFPER